MRLGIYRLLSRLLRRSEVGTAAVEFAVALPVLVLLAIGATDYGRVYFAAIAVANAASAGAQYGAQKVITANDTASINQAARNDGADSAPITVTSRQFCRCDAGEINCAVGDCGVYGPYKLYVEVTASKTVDLLFRYPGLPTAIALTRVATFRVQ